MGPALAPTPELMEKVAALPPAADEPDVDVAAQTRLETPFRFSRFLRPFRWPLVAGLVLVALDGLATLAGPWLIRFGINEGVAKGAEGALWAASIAFLAITLADWWVMWAQTRIMGRTSERMLFALRVKLFAHLQRLGIDYFEREMAGRVMTRMTTDVDSLSQFLQTGLVTALVNGITLLGVAVALVFMDWQLALATSLVLPPLIAATVWFQRNSSRAYDSARQHIATRQREPAGGSLRRARLPGVRAGGNEPGRVRDRGPRLPRTPGSAPRSSSRCTSRSSRCSPSSPPRSCSASAASC